MKIRFRGARNITSKIKFWLSDIRIMIKKLRMKIWEGIYHCIEKMVGCYFVINVYLEQSFKRQILNKAFQVVTPCSYKKITQTKNIITVWWKMTLSSFVIRSVRQILGKFQIQVSSFMRFKFSRWKYTQKPIENRKLIFDWRSRFLGIYQIFSFGLAGPRRPVRSWSPDAGFMQPTQ